MSVITTKDGTHVHDAEGPRHAELLAFIKA